MQPKSDQNEETNKVGFFTRLYDKAITITPYLRYSSVIIATIAISAIIKLLTLETRNIFQNSICVLAITVLGFVVSQFITGKTKFIGIWRKIIMSFFWIFICEVMFVFGTLVWINKQIIFKHFLSQLFNPTPVVTNKKKTYQPVITPDSIYIEISDTDLKKQISTRLNIPLSDNPRARFILDFSYPHKLLKHSKELDEDIFEYWPGGKVTVSLKNKHSFSIKENIPEISEGSEREVVSQLETSIKKIIENNLNYICLNLKPHLHENPNNYVH